MKIYRKTLSVLVSASLIAASLCGCGTAAESASEQASSASSDTSVSDAASELENTAVSLLTTHGSEEGKEETVYIMADADGNIQDTVVSCWLKNPDEKEVIEDTTDLTDIENVKGNETYETDDDGNITWNADGNDIIYQGNSEDSLPITTQISYELDGRSVKAADLAGASGHLKVTFNYTNNITEQVEIGGEKVTIYQPFLVISGMLLDPAKASNVTVTNGKFMEVSGNDIVIGTAMPGLTESLGLDTLKNADGETLDLNIPQDVTIEADITDFSLLTTVTVYDNSALNALDLDDITSAEDLYALSDKVNDAISKLEDGSSSLNTGTSELVSGADQINSGAQTLNSGAAAISENTGTLSSGIQSALAGANQLSAGLAQLQGSISDLPSGVNALYSGAVSLSSALKSNSADEPGVYEGASAISAGAAAIASGLKSGDSENPGISEAAQAISAGAAAISAGAKSNDASNPGIYEAAAMVKSGLDSAAESLSTGLGTAVSGLQAASGYDQNAIDTLTSLLASPNLTAEQSAAIQGAIAYISGSKQYTDGVSTALAGTSVDFSSADTALDGICSGAEQIASGADSITTAAGSVASGADVLNNGALQIQAAADSIASGVDEMISGNDGNNVNALISGLSTLSSSSGELVSAVNTLTNGSYELASGTNTLAEGSSALYAGTQTLQSGTASLANGTASLSSGASELLDGTKELTDGINTFGDEITSKLATLVDGDLHNFIDRLKALQAFAGEYSSFSGTTDDLPCSVKFIMRTDSI